MEEGRGKGTQNVGGKETSRRNRGDSSSGTSAVTRTRLQ